MPKSKRKGSKRKVSKGKIPKGYKRNPLTGRLIKRGGPTDRKLQRGGGEIVYRVYSERGEYEDYSDLQKAMFKAEDALNEWFRYYGRGSEGAEIVEDQLGRLYSWYDGIIKDNKQPTAITFPLLEINGVVDDLVAIKII
jgi:hypothetical protein